MALWKCCCSGKEDEGCCSNFSRTQFNIWTAIVIMAGVFIFLVLAFCVVRGPEAAADDAVLQRFALTPADPAVSPYSNISYNITATVSLWNPNLYTMKYGALAVIFSFNGTRFHHSAASAPGFELQPWKMATVRVRVGAEDKPVKLTKPGVGEFRAEYHRGWFAVELRLDTVLQYKDRTAKCPLIVVCPLWLQLLDPDDVAATSFQTTKCTVLRAKSRSGS